MQYIVYRTLRALRICACYTIIEGMKSRLRSTLLPLLTALIWGTAFVAQDVCAGYIPPMTFNALRFAAAVVFLALVKLVIRAVKGRRAPEAPEAPADNAPRRMLLIAGALCGTALAVASNLQQAGMELGLDAGKSGFITALYVVLVPLGGLILGKKLQKIFWAALPLAVLGLYLLCINGAFTIAAGDVLTLLCAAAFTVQILLIDRYASKLEPISFCIAEFVTASVLSAAGALLFEKPDWSLVAARIWPLLYVAVFSCGVAYLLQIIAQREGDPAIVSLLFSMESVFSVIGGAIILRQSMTLREYLGCALIFAAVILVQLRLPGQKTDCEEPPPEV